MTPCVIFYLAFIMIKRLEKSTQNSKFFDTIIGKEEQYYVEGKLSV